MTNNTGFGFFKDSESFLTELSDLESEYVSGGGKCHRRRKKRRKGSRSKSKSKSYSYS